ncbi:hypothetical protein D3C83_173290 [compost metagenome]
MPTISRVFVSNSASWPLPYSARYSTSLSLIVRRRGPAFGSGSMKGPMYSCFSMSKPPNTPLLSWLYHTSLRSEVIARP